MARSLWTGSINFGLVNVPVRLVTAVRDKRIHFHMLTPEGDCRLRRKLYCPDTGEEYDMKDTARGYEIAPDQYVIIHNEELDQIKPEKGRTIDIEQFVDLHAIDPIYFDRAYYLLPGEEGDNAYALLAQAMRQREQVGVARFVMRENEHLVAIRPVGQALVLHTLHYAEEVTPPDELEDPPPDASDVQKKQLQVAGQLIDSLSEAFDISAFKNEYRDQLQQLIENKAEGEQVTAAAEQSQEQVPPTYNLMDALKESVEQQGGAKQKGGGKGKRISNKNKRKKQSA